MRLGLSRRISPNREDIERLVSEWERRDERFSFAGSTDELMKLKTHALAISYRHASESEWDRNGNEFISKMKQEDQELLANSLLELWNETDADDLMIRCDQIIFKRLGKLHSDTAWYNNGLLPYMCMSVLFLSPYEANIENKLWIRAERSLGRMAYGSLVYEHTKGITFSTGLTSDPHSVLKKYIETNLKFKLAGN